MATPLLKTALNLPIKVTLSDFIRGEVEELFLKYKDNTAIEEKLVRFNSFYLLTLYKEIYSNILKGSKTPFYFSILANIN